MGRERAMACQRLGADVVTFCDSDLDRARDVARLFGGGDVESNADRIPWRELDALFVCTPPFVRGPVEVQAVNRGVHLFMEKPLGVSAEQCAPLVAALRASPVITAVGYMNRYRSWMQGIRDQLAGAEILGITANWSGRRYGVPWWADTHKSGGPINEQATHLIDLCRYLVGEIVEVKGIVDPVAEDADGAEGAVLSLRFANDSIGTMFYSCRAKEKLIDLLVYTVDSRIHLTDWDFHPIGEASRSCVADTDVFTDEVRAFFAVIEGGARGTIRSDLFDALRTQRVVDAVRRSVRSGETVRPR